MGWRRSAAAQRQPDRGRSQVDASPQQEGPLPPERNREDRTAGDSEDYSGIPEGTLESHRAVEGRPLKFASDPRDSDRMIETRADSGERDEEQERPEVPRKRGGQGPEAQDDNPNRKESRRIAAVRHDAEQDLKDRGDDERGPAEEADLRGTEATEERLQHDDLACESRDRAIVREMVERVCQG